MPEWSFLTSHGKTLLLIASQPDARLRDLASALELTERTTYGIVADLTEAGYVVKTKDGRRNRYEIRTDLPLRGATTKERTVGDLLDLLVDANPPPSGRKRPSSPKR